MPNENFLLLAMLVCIVSVVTTIITRIVIDRRTTNNALKLSDVLGYFGIILEKVRDVYDGFNTAKIDPDLYNNNKAYRGEIINTTIDIIMSTLDENGLATDLVKDKDVLKSVAVLVIEKMIDKYKFWSQESINKLINDKVDSLSDDTNLMSTDVDRNAEYVDLGDF